VVKQHNNGTTFVISDVEIPGLTDVIAHIAPAIHRPVRPWTHLIHGSDGPARQGLDHVYAHAAPRRAAPRRVRGCTDLLRAVATDGYRDRLG